MSSASMRSGRLPGEAETPPSPPRRRGEKASSLTPEQQAAARKAAQEMMKEEVSPDREATPERPRREHGHEVDPDRRRRMRRTMRPDNEVNKERRSPFSGLFSKLARSNTRNGDEVSMASSKTARSEKPTDRRDRQRRVSDDSEDSTVRTDTAGGRERVNGRDDHKRTDSPRPRDRMESPRGDKGMPRRPDDNDGRRGSPLRDDRRKESPLSSRLPRHGDRHRADSVRSDRHGHHDSRHREREDSPVDPRSHRGLNVDELLASKTFFVMDGPCRKCEQMIEPCPTCHRGYTWAELVSERLGRRIDTIDDLLCKECGQLIELCDECTLPLGRAEVMRRHGFKASKVKLA